MKITEITHIIFSLIVHQTTAIFPNSFYPILCYCSAPVPLRGLKKKVAGL